MTDVFALDTETERLPPRESVLTKSGRRVYTSPYRTPRLVLVSIARGDDSWLFTPEEFKTTEFCGALKRATGEVVMHNASFDLDVLEANDMLTRQETDALVRSGRVHDTMILDMLLGLATGRFELPKWQHGRWVQHQFQPASLARLAKRWCGITLDKNAATRCEFGRFLGRPLADIPESFQYYARLDAELTLRVFRALLLELRRITDGWLTEDLQIRTALAFHRMDKAGINVDTALAARLRTRFEGYLEAPRQRLIAAGLGRRQPKPGTQKKRRMATPEPDKYLPQIGDTWSLLDGELVKIRRFKTSLHEYTAEPSFTLNTKAIQARLEPIAVVLHKRAPRRADGSLSLDYDFWHEHAPARDEALQAWLQHEKIKKILTTYLDLYSQTSRVFPRWRPLGARSGRTSAGSPNIQNIPKRKFGIRSLFHAGPGNSFVIADYSAQELFTLAEVMAHMGIEGPLLEICKAFNGGRGPDLHRYGAALVLGKPINEITPEERQGQKVLHFGVPGGLGPAKLAEYAFKTYGVDWSVDEAKARRSKFLAHFHDIAEYLSRFNTSRSAALRAVTGQGERWWREELQLHHWNTIREMLQYPDPDIQEIAERAQRQQVVMSPSGRIRGYCKYTEAANFGFQGLASDVSKLALSMASEEGLNPVIFCHDEIVVEVPTAAAETAKQRLEQIMKQAFCHYCPNVGAYTAVDSKIGDRWGPTTDIEGRIIEG